MNRKIIKCIVCNDQLDKEIIALNRKMIGRNLKKFSCIKCFAEHFDVTVEELKEKIQDFKDQGCSLFF